MVTTEYLKQREGCFSSDFVEKIENLVEGLAKETRDQSDIYKKSSDHPDRYSYFYATIINDANYIVFIIKFSHINRKHSLSPDGWALLQNEKSFYIRVHDIE